MSHPRRIPLNPCDAFFLAHQRAMERRGPWGNVLVMVCELEGPCDHGRLRESVRRAMVSHPVVLAELRVSRLGGRPYWRLPDRLEDAAERAVAGACTHIDATGGSDGEAAFDREWQPRNILEWGRAAWPQVRIEHYDLPDGRTRIGVRFPHPLLDGEGAQWFLHELSDGATHASAPESSGNSAGRPLPESEHLREDWGMVDPLEDCTILQRIGLARETLAQLRRFPQDGPPEPEAASSAGTATITNQHVLHRVWDARALRTMRAGADTWAPPGPARHARYTAMCVLRALDRLNGELGLETSRYLLPFPMGITAVETGHGRRLRRPLPGNYTISPTLAVSPDVVRDRTALGQEVLVQVQRYLDNRAYLGQWALLWLASLMRLRMYEWVLGRQSGASGGVGFESLSSGFSFLGWMVPASLRSIAGVRVGNFWGHAPMGMPPGWNPIFNKFGPYLNMTLSWPRPAVPDERARRYAEFIEEELFQAPEPAHDQARPDEAMDDASTTNR